jgi:Spy/CpxP family protein refolding chaperone
MRRFSRISTIGTLSASLLLTPAIFAQGQFGPRGTPGTPPDPATMVADQVARLAALLDLTTAQANQATSILTAAQTATSALQTTLHTDQTSLQAAIKSNTTATIDQMAAAIGTIEGQILDARSQAEAAFYAILTTTQQTKLSAVGGLGLLGGGPGGPGRGGPHP